MFRRCRLWAGEVRAYLTSPLRREIHRSKKEILELSVIQDDRRHTNIRWTHELDRASMIGFHWSKLDPRPVSTRSRPAKKNIGSDRGTQ
ncbi:hypothetical protein PDIG_56570 [Penicillium digitatum PHI26]|uniref:Uncharacterized protein n=2 Tax=Penicillium digitatum TaxID=36651 RepID=K9G6D7_PEND2|nr:hypothetical protein PDIP_66130 [Penicillium digitatum Pd1]EKV09102.1 hypothetical protein PDIP_66130 [Penicillium digitatum Pd1]EKV10368.1 hypothetical protein PDIG_56570 [Penicillium digitatum PHI26]